MTSSEGIIPMTMSSFFEASRGTWLNRRVVHHLDCQDDEAADSNLIIEPFDTNDPVVEKVACPFVVNTNRKSKLKSNIFFLPCELSDFLPIHGPKIATIIIAVEVAKPSCWSVQPFSLTNHTEKYKPGIMNA